MRSPAALPLNRARLRAVAYAGVAGAMIAVVATGCATSDIQTPGDPISTESATSTQVVPLDSVADTSDARNLVALSTHIFTGKVQAVGGTEALNSTPETQFDVTTGLSLKGSVAKNVVVNQQGGTVGGVYLSVGDDEPLVVGQWYLFATRILESKAWFTAIPADGTIEITADDARDISSAPLVRLTTALTANPRGQIIVPPPVTPPTMTFPIPTPGEENPPPPSPPQPTP